MINCVSVENTLQYQRFNAEQIRDLRSNCLFFKFVFISDNDNGLSFEVKGIEEWIKVTYSTHRFACMYRKWRKVILLSKMTCSHECIRKHKTLKTFDYINTTNWIGLTESTFERYSIGYDVFLHFHLFQILVDLTKMHHLVIARSKQFTSYMCLIKHQHHFNNNTDSNDKMKHFAY